MPAIWAESLAPDFNTGEGSKQYYIMRGRLNEGVADKFLLSLAGNFNESRIVHIAPVKREPPSMTIVSPVIKEDASEAR